MALGDDYTKLLASDGADAFSGGMKILGGIASPLQGIFQARLMREQGKIAAQSAEFAAKMAENRRETTMLAAKAGIQQYKQQVGQLKGKQKASFAGQGVKVTGNDGDVVSQTTAETDRIANEDVIAALANARNEAYGYGVEAMQLRTQGRMALDQSKFASTASILGGITKGIGDIGSGAMQVAKVFG